MHAWCHAESQGGGGDCVRISDSVFQVDSDE
jgi:hypothetical protein